MPPPEFFALDTGLCRPLGVGRTRLKNEHPMPDEPRLCVSRYDRPR